MSTDIKTKARGIAATLGLPVLIDGDSTTSSSSSSSFSCLEKPNSETSGIKRERLLYYIHHTEGCVLWQPVRDEPRNDVRLMSRCRTE